MDTEVFGTLSFVSNKYFQGLKEKVLSSSEEQDEYIWEVPEKDERVCFLQDEGEDHWLWMYDAPVTWPSVRFPFSEFQVSVLRLVSIGPAQIHPNSWAMVILVVAI